MPRDRSSLYLGILLLVFGGGTVALLLTQRAQAGSPSLGLSISTDKAVYAPASTMTITIQSFDRNTLAAIPNVYVAVVLNNVVQKYVTTNSLGIAVTNLTTQLGTGPGIVAAQVGTIVATATFLVQ